MGNLAAVQGRPFALVRAYATNAHHLLPYNVKGYNQIYLNEEHRNATGQFIV